MLIILNAMPGYVNYGMNFFGYGTYEYFVICKAKGGTNSQCNAPGPGDLVKEYKSNLRVFFTKSTQNTLIKINQQVCADISDDG